MLDLLCSEYGWTVEQIFDHTKDQIMLLVESMMKRKKVDIKFQADIHGAEMKSDNSKSVDIDKDFNKLSGMGINVVKG